MLSLPKCLNLVISNPFCIIKSLTIFIIPFADASVTYVIPRKWKIGFSFTKCFETNAIVFLNIIFVLLLLISKLQHNEFFISVIIFSLIIINIEESNSLPATEFL